MMVTPATGSDGSRPTALKKCTDTNAAATANTSPLASRGAASPPMVRPPPRTPTW